MARDVLWRRGRLRLEARDLRGDAVALYVIVRAAYSTEGYVLRWERGEWRMATPTVRDDLERARSLDAGAVEGAARVARGCVGAPSPGPEGGRVRRALYQAALTGAVLAVAIPMACVSVAVAYAAPAGVRRRWDAFFWGPVDAAHDAEAR